MLWFSRFQNSNYNCFLDFFWEPSCFYDVSEKLCKLLLSEHATTDQELLMDIVNAWCLSTLECLGNLIRTKITNSSQSSGHVHSKIWTSFFILIVKSWSFRVLDRPGSCLVWCYFRISSEHRLHLVFSAGSRLSTGVSEIQICRVSWSNFVCIQSWVHGIMHLLLLDHCCERNFDTAS